MLTSNLLSGVPVEIPEEIFQALIHTDHVKIERIIFHGQSLADDFWYDQDRNEWVLLLRGYARIRFEDHKQVELSAGASPFFAPEMGSARFAGAKNQATAMAFGGPRSSCVRPGAHSARRQDSRKDLTPCRMALHFVSAGAHAPHSDETLGPTATRGSSHSARRLRSLAFLCSSQAII